ncbi:MAG: peptidoglycan-binding domain-containing protein [Solirubrobacteraceae bacterium]
MWKLPGERGWRVRGHRLPRASAVLLTTVLVAGGSLSAAGSATGARGVRPNPFAGRGMWIWVLSSSNGGDLASIIARARRNGISTLMIKSGDGTGVWSQFSPTMVATLHAAGLHVCAWQYVYGSDPVGEAQVGAASVANGADCLLIDAESEYEGKYISAQTYLTTLRGLIGQRFPVALAGFPYVDYHPAFPYSVFLGPGGAQFNVPQMYWQDIGDSVNAVYDHTYTFNRPYGRPLFPLGQVYNSPPTREILRFRQLSRAYRAANVSWWDWQEATSGSFFSISRPVGLLARFSADPSYAGVGRGTRGDLVVWAQEHLSTAGYKLAIDGDFGPKTQAAVERFQSARGLARSGVIDSNTWRALLRYRPAAVRWVIKRNRITATIAGARVLPVPGSAHLRARRDELPGAPGRGRPQ